MASALRKEEGFGLGIAIAAHVAIVAVLLLRPQSTPVVQPPERITVTISDDIALTSTSPQPASEPAAAVAPSLGEPQPQAASEPVPPAPQPPAPQPPAPEPAPARPTPPRPAPPPKAAPAPPSPRPEPRKVQEPAPRPVPTPAQRPPEKAAPTPPRPAAKAPAAPPSPKAQPAPKAPAPKAVPKASPSASPAPKATSQAAPKASAQTAPNQKGAASAPAPKAATKSAAPAGGSRIGSDFLEGVAGARAPERTASAGTPAAAIGPAVRASLASAISRQLKPRWQAPQGPDAEELVTILSFNLNRDGSLAGAPTVVRQLGINDTNRNQAERHAEQAVRAIRLAAPFDLPEEYYDAWKRVSAFRFDKRLSQ